MVVFLGVNKKQFKINNKLEKVFNYPGILFKHNEKNGS